MVKKYQFGTPINTGAVVQEIPVTAGALPYFCVEDNRAFSLELSKEDIVYGLGQQVRGINKRGWKYVSSNTDDPHHHEDKTSLYGAHNFLLLSGTRLFGIFFDTPGKITFDIGYTKQSILTVTAEESGIFVYVITGEKEKDILRQFRRLTGRSYIAPKWALGYGQSRWGYKNEQDIRRVAKNYRQNHIPLDAIYVDIDYMERYKDFTVDKERFPDFPGLVREMKEQGIHLVPIIDAGVKLEKGYETYEEGVAGNYFCKDGDGNDFVAAVWPGRVHFPDVLNADAAKWFGEKYEFLLSQGVDGFWNDMNEPAVFYTEERLKETIVRVNELAGTSLSIDEYFEMVGVVNSLGNNPEDYQLFYHNMDEKKVRHDKVHNLFGFYMTKAAAEAFDRLVPEQRILLFSRSSYVGMHRYGGIWQGDNKSWWSHLLLNIQMTANLNMVGFLYTGADLGGFGCDATEDLVLRWLQFAVFTPLMRNHASNGTREQEVYQFSNMESCKHMIEIRYGLLPYIYSEYVKAALRDELMFAPLGFEFHDEISQNIEDQLLFGKELMLAPVYQQNATGRGVWLPEEMLLVRMRTLSDYDTEVLPAGYHYVPVKLEELVFFVRKGRAIPVCDGGECTAELKTDSLRMLGYEGAAYELYDDDGLTKDISEKNIRIICKNA